MIDVGTGSGILACAAVKLGAAKVLAVDNDATAIKAAKENVAQNDATAAVTLAVGDLLSGVDERADLIIANIVANVILRLLPDAAARLTSDGRLLTGGIIADRLDEVCRAAQAVGLTAQNISSEKEWRAVIFTRGEDK